MPLCMGIAVASGVPPEKGLITGIIGGIVVGLMAGSPLQVSGPAAGLAGRARRGGATVVIVNPDESEIDAEAHVVLRGTAARVLPALLAPA